MGESIIATRSEKVRRFSDNKDTYWSKSLGINRGDDCTSPEFRSAPSCCVAEAGPSDPLVLLCWLCCRGRRDTSRFRAGALLEACDFPRNDANEGTLRPLKAEDDDDEGGGGGGCTLGPGPRGSWGDRRCIVVVVVVAAEAEDHLISRPCYYKSRLGW